MKIVVTTIWKITIQLQLIPELIPIALASGEDNQSEAICGCPSKVFELY